MMKIKRTLSLFLLFSLVFTALFSFVQVSAVDNNSTKVNIVKVKIKDKQNFVLKDHDGTELTGEKLKTHFGEAPEFLANVTFKLYKVTEPEKMNQLKTQKADTEAKVKAVLGEVQPTQTVTTGTNGVGSINSLEDGNYWVIEDVRPAGYVDAQAVPFELKLPLYNGLGRMSEVWIYPKNSVILPFDPTPPTDPDDPDAKEPGLKKVVVDNTGDTPKEITQGTYNLNEEHTWKIQLIAPDGINSLQNLIVRENLDKRFDFVVDSLEVKINDTKLTETTDYEKTVPDTNNRLLSVKFKTDTLKTKIEKDDRIIITYKTKLNSSAQMGAAVYNGVQVVWGQGPDPDHYSEIPPAPEVPTPPTYIPPTPDVPKPNIPDPKVPDPEKPVPPTPPAPGIVTPEIHFGGKKFVKQDSLEENKKLAGAEFVIKKVVGDKTYVLKKDYSYVLDTEVKYNEDLETQNIMVLKSKESTGAFEIVGLAFGSYKLVEVKAPDKYALPSNPVVDFEITARSYFENVSDSTLAAALGINNTLLSIPQTGGIGTVIFIVGGILLMLGAGFVAFKRRKADN